MVKQSAPVLPLQLPDPGLIGTADTGAFVRVTKVVQDHPPGTLMLIWGVSRGHNRYLHNKRAASNLIRCTV